jgi:hypothetical protein
MPHLDLTEDEAAALVALLSRTIDGDRYPLSPRVRVSKDILAKLTPEPDREPVPPPKGGRDRRERPSREKHRVVV